VKRLDAQSFLSRDWAALARVKAKHRARLTPAQALRLSSDLRDHARLSYPDWPTAKDREEDWKTHARVAQALRSCPPLRRR
jgi:hypothetical protein